MKHNSEANPAFSIYKPFLIRCLLKGHQTVDRYEQVPIMVTSPGGEGLGDTEFRVGEII
jgi:hypothetical protein